MQRLLNPSEVALIDERLHDNALLGVCREIWPERQEEITSVMVQPVDIFYESAWLIDELVEANTDTDTTSHTRGLWSTVSNDIGYWANGVSLSDRYLIASTIFRLVATSLSLHWHSYYCNMLRDALLTMVEERRPSPENLHERQRQERQQEELLDAIINCSATLSKWVNDYIDNPDQWLTEEIEQALNPTVTVVKTERGEVGITKIKRKRKEWKDDIITHSFDYRPKAMPVDERNKRLSIFFTLLNRRFVSHTNQKTFINIFSGVTTLEYIVWRGFVVELQYFINTLITEGLISWSRPAPGKWQIACARFRLEHNVIEIDERTETKKSSKVIDKITPQQFNKIPAKNKLKEHPILDKIIAILKEESDSMKINREVMEMFARMENKEKEDKDKQKQTKEIDY